MSTLVLAKRPKAPAVRDEQGPLSASQERIWLFQQLNPGTTAFHLVNAVHVPRSLRADELEEAVNFIISQQGSLRTAIIPEGQSAQQLVRERASVRVRREDVSDLDEARQAEALDRLAKAESATPFDLTEPPLMRCVLVARGPNRATILFVVHHIVFDGWSFGILYRSLFEYYTRKFTGTAAAPTGFRKPYLQYAREQRDRFEANSDSAVFRYAKETLADADFRCQLPYGLRRNENAPPIAGVRSFWLEDERRAELAGAARAQRASINMLLLASFLTLLWRHTGQSDIVVGVPVTSRHELDTHATIGLFVDTVMVRVKIQAGCPFTDLLRQVRHGILAAQGHGEIPPSVLAEISGRDERGRRKALWPNVMFTVDDTVVEEMETDGSDILRQVFESGGVSSDFKLVVSPNVERGRTLVTFEYNAAIFKPAVIEALVSQIHAILDAVRDDPAILLSRVPLGPTALGDHETEATAGGKRHAFADLPLHDIDEADLLSAFEARVAARPWAIAVCSDDQSWTYAELDAWANGVARLLRARGSRGAGDRVALLFKHNAEMIAAILGVLKTGAAYVPLDSGQPIERLAAIAADASSCCLFHAEDLAEMARALAPRTAASMREVVPSFQSLGVRRSPSDVSYTLYTSGTSGRPKGVIQIDRNVIHHISAYAEALGIGPSDRLSLAAPYGFDAAVMDIYGALLTGASLHLYDVRALGVDAIPAWLERTGVTIAHFTPTVLRSAFASPEARMASKVRLMILGGEAAYWSDVALVKDRASGSCQLVNGYGPTEATVVAQFFPDMDAVDHGRLPVGRPVARTQILLLDAERRPTDLMGEVAVCGGHAAVGYLNDPALTEDRMIASPLGDGKRVYRTGDLGRWRHDGTLEIFGRIDDQVKIRGHRVEPDEVAAILAQHDVVASAFVIARENDAGDVGLAAYVVLKASADFDAAGHPGDIEEVIESVKHYARLRLPEYMTPFWWVALDRAPLTANGKIDRRMLPVPANPIGQSAIAAPITPTEVALARIWSRRLGVENIGRHDNFFGLGGHSLLATRVLAEIRQELNADLPLRAIFDSRDLADLAARVERSEPRRPALAIEAIPSGQRGGPWPLSFAQERMWLLDQLDDLAASYVLPFSVQLSGAVDVAALQASVSSLAERQDAIATRLEVVAGVACQRRCEDADIKLAFDDFSGLPAQEREERRRRATLEESSTPFQLVGGALFRARLIKFSQDDFLLVGALHHIISDLASVEILLSELATGYRAAREGTLATLPRPAVQYLDFVRWQRSASQQARVAQQSAFWRKALAGAPAALPLPLDFERPALQSHRGGAEGFSLSGPLSKELRGLARKENVSLFMLLTASFQALLSRWTGEGDIVVGTPISGRAHPSLERVIGLFVNLIALRVDISDNPPFSQLLRRTADRARDAYANQDAPFERVVNEINPVRDLSRHPIFQVLIALQTTLKPEAAIETAGAMRIGDRVASAKFDLSLYIYEDAERIHGFFEYAADLFREESIAGLARQWEMLLAGIVTAPATRISQFDIVPAGDRRTLLERFSGVDQQFPAPPLPVPRQVMRRAAERPDAIAVVVQGERLSYRELDRRSNRVANGLRALGVAPGAVVGVFLERSFDLVVALLGVWKAGATYLPLEPSLPDARLEAMARDSRVALVVTQASLSDRSAASVATRAVIDSETSIFADQSETRPEWGELGSSAAYVLYTSGSTGGQKGVAIPHAALAAFIAAMQISLRPTTGDIFAATTPISFDIAGLELWLPLASGASVAIADRATTQSGSDLGAFLTDVGATIFQATPSMWRLLADAGWRGRSGMKALCGGEALTDDVARVLLEGHEEAWNLYGPTETTIWSTAKRLTGTSPSRVVGRPIVGTYVYVLDPERQLAPIGSVGEIWIGGRGLADGYFGRPELTRERFVEDPFRPGGRIYRTGDLGRWRHDGDLEVLGRIDEQVKIRGHRVEPGEVAAVLMRHPKVATAIVTANTTEAGDLRLAAYYVLASESVAGATDGASLAALEADLRGYARQGLPEYMVPFWWKRLDKAPLTVNGKVDRRALPAPTAPVGGSFNDPPATPVEKFVAEIWSREMGVREVGRSDNFFRLGGHSLLAARVLSEMREKLGLEMPLRAMFEAVDLADLARRAEAELARVGASARVGGSPGRRFALTLMQAGRTDPIVLFPGLGGGLRVFDSLLAALGPGVTVYGFESAEPLHRHGDLASLVSGLEASLEEDQALKRCALVGWSFGALLAFEAMRSVIASGRTGGRLVLLDPPGRNFAAAAVADADDLWRRFVGDLALAMEVEFPSFGLGNPGEDIRLRCHKLELAMAESSPLARAPKAGALSAMYDAYRRDFEVLSAYTPLPLRCDGLIVRATKKPNSQVAEAWDWSRLCAGTTWISELDATHYGMLRGKGAARIARTIEDSVARR
jgi:amino acid adenylation domain-containing protein